MVGAQLESARVGGWAWSGPRNVPLLFHAPDGTRRGIHAPWNRGSIGVRSRLENGSRVMEADHCLAFGDVSLDLAKGQLLCSGEVVALTPKAFAVLRRLVDDGGHGVSTGERVR